MNIHFIMHESFESPGAYEQWTLMRGYSVSYTRVYLNEKLPLKADSIDVLVVLGGPQSPDTTISECPYFDSESEMQFIRYCIDHNKAVIGVCLGAQLIGEALGAKYEHSPEKEIGKFPITLTDAGLSDNNTAHFGNTLEVGHWHNDMPGLTKDAQILAYSAGCPRQIIKYDRFVYGFQCHMEFTKDVVRLLIENSEHEWTQSVKKIYVQNKETLLKNTFDNMNNVLYQFLDKLVIEYRTFRQLV